MIQGCRLDTRCIGKEEGTDWFWFVDVIDLFYTFADVLFLSI